MELIAVETSRFLNLFLARRLAGQLYMPSACQALVDRYRFVVRPSSIEEMTKDPISFGHGVFEDVAIDSFDIYSDGIIATSKSPTDVLDAFVSDVVAWSNVELNLDRVETHKISKMYESHILIKSDKDLLKPLNELSDVSKAMSGSMKKATGQDVKFQPFGLTFAADHSVIPGLKPIAFRLERKASTEFEMGYYVSSAPLRTKDHLHILQKIEHLA